MYGCNVSLIKQTEISQQGRLLHVNKNHQRALFQNNALSKNISSN
jgi:hypothetical protein